ncbi:fumarylacetoacetase [Variovorax terrae]|uniref:fumarylacetoacetase n=1 Tax=Variovorax terrae TaxID=2923278 RepID=A0A9X1W1R4_9BURK|nr:fumarylacetoacetase [Variovorax terrae]MCJ0766172.1 fumarylacetoacetase [Variovorax terrae]
MYAIDTTHDPERTSWVETANASDTDFPIQNLPFGRFRTAGSADALQIGVAIGDQILDLRTAGLIFTDDMNALMAAPTVERRALRRKLSDGLSAGSSQQAAWEKALVPQSACELGVPCRIGDYTDFYVGIHHATAVGKLFRPDNPLLPNYKWVPIGYHGRASSIVPHGTSIRRPKGQTAGAKQPGFGPSQRLDLELELGFLVGKGNALGTSVAITEAEEHLFGVTLFNDWSARDIQAWEYQPLGPFLAKNFGSTISPWIVTMEALAPFRAPFAHPASDPQPLPYLDAAANREQGSLDIQLEVLLQTAAMREAGLAPVTISRSNAAQASYWTPAQLIAHHTVNGCNLQPGDLLGSGTLSGPAREQAGSLLEATLGGKEPLVLPNGERRTFLQDGDTLSLSGYCERPGARRIGFGPCAGTILPSV